MDDEKPLMGLTPEEERSDANTERLFQRGMFLFGILLLGVVATAIVAVFAFPSDPDPVTRPLAPRYPQGCLWVGHLAPDVDSYCTAMAAAELFKGSYSIAEGPPNTETMFVVKNFGFPEPPLFMDIYTDETECIGIVDHNQRVQSPLNLYNIPREKLASVIDHHSIQSDAVTTENIIHIDVKPWGSTSSLLFELFMYTFIQPSEGAAQCMLSAILSDTLGLTGPTTTEYDIEYANELAPIANVKNITELYLEMGKAKSDISMYTTDQVINLDAKEYLLMWASGEECLVYWGTLETFTPNDVLDNLDEYLQEMVKIKADQGFDMIFFSVVNALGTFAGDMENISTLLLIGAPESLVANATFTPKTFSPTDKSMDLSPRVSRKKEFIPPIDFYISHTNRSVYFP